MTVSCDLFICFLAKSLESYLGVMKSAEIFRVSL